MIGPVPTGTTVADPDAVTVIGLVPSARSPRIRTLPVTGPDTPAGPDAEADAVTVIGPVPQGAAAAGAQAGVAAQADADDRAGDEPEDESETTAAKVAAAEPAAAVSEPGEATLPGREPPGCRGAHQAQPG